MKSITSVSGGRTSSYMALHYPTDYNIFSLVRIEDKRCTPKDKKLIQYVEDKIQKPFIATAESDLTLYVLIQLEQDLGKEIIWVTGPTFEQIIKEHDNYLPNRLARYCTTELKLTPIFWYCYLRLFEDENDTVKMHIGYRAEEKHRKANDVFKFVESCNYYGQNRQSWQELEWRLCEYPLRKNYIDHFTIRRFFFNKPKYIFPKTSNCAFCFNKTEEELFEQFADEPNKMNWAKSIEKQTGNTFNFNFRLSELETNSALISKRKQPSLFGCECTD